MKNIIIIFLCFFMFSCDGSEDSNLKDDLVGIWIIKQRCNPINYCTGLDVCFTSSLLEGNYEYITFDDLGYLEYCSYIDGNLDCSLDGNYWTLYEQSIQICGMFSDAFCKDNMITFDIENNVFIISGNESDDLCGEWNRELILQPYNNN